ncbi:rad17 checkpoint clamp loader component isoform X2 [Choristoneura fumiferana]|uniref:rad17 checkpoint clamp loader component isoform X2 n=1 Tax=Choristoneura fumiferana TaxID=7141 RepID=UPI003D15B582
MSIRKEKKWFKPVFDFDADEPSKKVKKTKDEDLPHSKTPVKVNMSVRSSKPTPILQINHKNWMKNFDPVTVEDLAVNNKKIQDIYDWIKSNIGKNDGEILLLTGPVGCGKTITVRIIAAKHNIKVTEWITPLDIEMPTEYGDYEFKEKQSTKFLDFILNAANFTSLLDNNSTKLVLVEDLPNTFLRTPAEFTDVLHQYKQRAKSPIVFICSESHSDSKNTAANLFTPSVKEQFKIHHIILNAVSATGLKAALKRVSEIISKKHTTMYNKPTAELIDCVVNSSAGDVRSAVLNLHFACLKGSYQSMETDVVIEKEPKGKKTTNSKKKQPSSRFVSLGKDQTVSILHGVGRVLNPKFIESENGSKRLTHPPKDIIDQFLSQPSSFINFLEENYLSHFSLIDHVANAALGLSDADFMLAEWREKILQEYGLYTSVAGLMIANKAPVSAWNPVRGPKTMKIQYPSPKEMPLLEQNYLYKGKILVADYQTYYKIIDKT